MFANALSNLVRGTLESVLEAMKSHPTLNFFLTGSRYHQPVMHRFGKNDNRDHDFFVQYSEECYDWLRKQGFVPIYHEDGIMYRGRKIIGSSYGSKDSVCVLRFVPGLFTYQSDTMDVMSHVGEHIDVQLVKAEFMDAKKSVNELVKTCPSLVYGSNKYARRYIWDCLLKHTMIARLQSYTEATNDSIKAMSDALAPASMEPVSLMGGSNE